MKKWLLAVLCVGVFGCSFVVQELNAPGFNEKLVDMDKADVINTLGNPESVYTVIMDEKPYEIWNYPVARQGKINKVGYAYYQVVFLDDKVNRYACIHTRLLNTRNRSRPRGIFPRCILNRSRINNDG